MNDGDSLLAVILANPDDDTPRLVYADWLDEHGQPEFAEFIRVQIEIARTPETVSVVALDQAAGEGEPPILRDVVNPQFDALREREHELWTLKRADEWVIVPSKLFAGDTEHLIPSDFLARQPARPASPVTVYRRGFPSEVRCTGEEREERSDAICAAAPVRRVVFTDEPPPVHHEDEVMRGGGWVYRYRVAGRLVAVPEEDVLALEEATGPAITRLALSARWPRIPPKGWAFLRLV